ncbi:MAG: copper chaperone PCu(A)C [Myxococcota bacterium]|jgi:hypothetical protein|nr:copper chaperone PCu(A)C [Myxococcota bacterium]
MRLAGSISKWLLLAFTLAAGSLAHAAEAGAEQPAFPIRVSDARSHPNLGVPVGVAYFSLHNTSGRDDRLLRVESSVAKMVELHESLEQDGMMRMKHHPKGFPIAAGEVVNLEPGGKHVMLMQLTGSLAEGDKVPLVLVFEHAGRLEIDIPVVPRSK